MKLAQLMELRRNPEMNPKQDPHEVVRQLAAQHGIDRLFVTFTEINKVGINPNSAYGTPIGIYAYTAKHFLETKTLQFTGEGSAPHLQVFTADQSLKLFHLQNATSDECNRIMKRVRELIRAKYGRTDLRLRPESASSIGASTWMWVDEACRFLATEKGKFKAMSSDHYDWDTEDDHTEFNPVNTGRKPKAMRANEIWRALGYDGAIDEGSAAIHSNEPHQAVFFSIKGIKVVGSTYNKLGTNSGAAQISQIVAKHNSVHK